MLFHTFQCHSVINRWARNSANHNIVTNMSQCHAQIGENNEHLLCTVFKDIHTKSIVQIIRLLLCVFALWVPFCDDHYDLHIKTMFGSSLLPVVCLIYIICVCLRIVVFNTYCVVFLFCLFSSCVTLPVSLDCPFLIVLSVFSNVYLISYS